jgi:hypothetical protein
VVLDSDLPEILNKRILRGNIFKKFAKVAKINLKNQAYIFNKMNVSIANRACFAILVIV